MSTDKAGRAYSARRRPAAKPDACPVCGEYPEDAVKCADCDEIGCSCVVSKDTAISDYWLCAVHAEETRLGLR